MQRISKAEHEYGGRRLKVGDRFHVEPKDVELLLALGRIEPEEGEAGYRTRDMAAAASREYQTRDAQRRARRAK